MVSAQWFSDFPSSPSFHPSFPLSFLRLAPLSLFVPVFSFWVSWFFLVFCCLCLLRRNAPSVTCYVISRQPSLWVLLSMLTTAIRLMTVTPHTCMLFFVGASVAC